ncbi:MAG: Gfo/Idh/MocA family oxidoreductase [Candidatus Syntrophosphaera sp.]|nr:Gfo/Idh/MocA family oxidoreductase [Candidatus Syntrophosphaera sp.]
MLKVAVVGVGHLGRWHAEKFGRLSQCRLMGLFDSRPEQARALGAKLGVKAYASYDELLGEVDAVDIAATTTAHYDLAKAALLAGKHVFIEKPITSELWQAEELVALANARQLKIQVGHIERFNPVTLEVDKYIQDPLFIESHRISTFQPRGTDVPVVLDLMIHDIDLILDFVQSPVKEINANGVGILTPSIDIANARIEFASGAIANVTSSRVSMKQERKIRFFQRDAYISLDFVAKQASVTKRSPDVMKYLPQLMLGNKDVKAEDLVDVQRFDLSQTDKDALSMELESFVDAVLNDKKPVVDGPAGLRALQIAMQIMDRIGKQPKTHI